MRTLSRTLLLTSVMLMLAGLLLWWWAPADLALHRMLRLDAGADVARQISWLSALGGLAVLGPVALIVVIMQAMRGDRAEALWLAATIISGRLLVEGLKIVIQRPRPPLADRLEMVTSWSFPSSHSAGSMMTGLALAMLAGGRSWQITLALIGAGIIGWSRVALAVHWPSDVLAGWGLGMAWVAVAMSAMKRPFR